MQWCHFERTTVADCWEMSWGSHRSLVTIVNAADVACRSQAHPTRRRWAELKLLQSNALSGGVFYLARTPFAVRVMTPAGHRTPKCYSRTVLGAESQLATLTTCLCWYCVRRRGKRLTVGAYSVESVVGEVYSCFHTATNRKSRCSHAHATSPAHCVHDTVGSMGLGCNFHQMRRLPLWTISSFSSSLSEKLVTRIDYVQQRNMKTWLIQPTSVPSLKVIIVINN